MFDESRSTGTRRFVVATIALILAGAGALVHGLVSSEPAVQVAAIGFVACFIPLGATWKIRALGKMFNWNRKGEDADRFYRRQERYMVGATALAFVFFALVWALPFLFEPIVSKIAGP